MTTNNKSTAIGPVRSSVLILLGMLAVMWVEELIDFLLPFWNLNQLGIKPREVSGLLGIPLSPFLHSGAKHLYLNSVPFLVLGGVVMLGGLKTFVKVSIWVVLIGGLGVWVLGRSGTVHIGASLLIFGYLGFLMSRGIFERSIRWLLVSLIILLIYAGMLWGMLPGTPGISWLGHLCGFLSGIAGAWLMFPKDGQLYGKKAGDSDPLRPSFKL